MADKDKKKQNTAPAKKPAPAKNTGKAPAKQGGKASPAKQDAAKSEEKLPRKERKKREKELLKQQLDLEKRLVEEGKIPARNKYKSNNFFWRVFAICLAFFFGLAGAIGGLVGFGVTASVHDVLGFAGIDTEHILHEEYARQSILDLVRDITSNSFDSLGSVSKYTPALDSYLETFRDAFADLGAHIDIDEIKATKFADLGTYFKNDVLHSVVLGETLGLTPDSNELFLGLCYGEQGVDYTVQDGKIVMKAGKKALTIGDLLPPNDVQDTIRKITIEQALGVTASSNAAMRFLAYGTEGTEYKIVDGKVVMLENELTGKPFPKKTLGDLTAEGETPIENAKISDLITVEGDAGILSAIKDWKISDLKETYRLERLRIDQIMDIDENSSSIARAIAGWRLGDFIDPAKMDSLTLGEVLSIDDRSPLILRSLKDTAIGEFGDAIDGLRLSDILEEKDFEGNRFLGSLRSSTLTSLAADLKALSAAQVFGDEMYSYLDPDEQYEKKNYHALYDYYKETGHTARESSGFIPKPVTVQEGEEIVSYYVHEAEATRLSGGYYTGVAGNYTAVPVKDVYERVAADGRTTEYYMWGEQSLTPSYAWRFVDYALGKLSPLPDGDTISADTQGYTVVPHEGTPYQDAGGQPLYYLTTRTAFLDGEPTADTERVAYPILQNDAGIYYCYLKYTPGGEGPDKFGDERVDLEYSLVTLSYESGRGAVTLTKNAAGKWSYIADEAATETVVSVYEKPSAEPEGAVGYYMKTEVAVHYGYFAAGDAVETVYDAADVTEKFVLKKADGSEKAVDRYLSGVWFFLFGTDEEGNLADNSDVPVLELDSKMSGIANSLSDTELWQLYFHGLLTSDPYVQLTGSRLFPDGIDIGGKKVTNLNECTVVECIKLVETLFQRMGGAG